ncbi:TauD/TfdA dioxygenase family protein [Altererythrobacter sp.]|uniref:TauD/TfdA dioxygenase family protein n=1 Tax=Altererythrobacter sp. TaxID=1872480 RepID=UPI003CFD985C
MTTTTQIRTGGTIVAGLPFPEFRHIAVQPMTGACGCEISGVDLREPLSDSVLEEVMQAFNHFGVIVFRHQDITPEQHKAFSRYFGELTELPQAPTYGNHEDMQEVRREADEPDSVVPSFETFHVDSPFLPRPPKCIIMRALDVPRFGGDTAFSNAYLVYEDLSDAMKELLEGLQVVYSGKHIWANNEKLPPERRLRLRDHHQFTEDQLESAHPVVRVNPETGRKGLFATTSYFQRFVGWSQEESRVLLDHLQGLFQRLHYHCRVKWEKDTLIVWDNRFTLHRGVHDYANERRHLIRTTVIGERPIGPKD